MNQEESTEEDPQLLEEEAYNPLYIPIHAKPVIIKQRNNSTGPPILFAQPLLGTLLFENTASDCRDHCANERTFLSWLRLSIYMSIVSVAIAVSFHLKKQPSNLEVKISVPLGVVFWLLSLACLVSGASNYFVTVGNYSRRVALVQSGWKTEVVFTVVAAAIVAACVLFFATEVSMSDSNNT